MYGLCWDLRLRCKVIALGEVCGLLLMSQWSAGEEVGGVSEDSGDSEVLSQVSQPNDNVVQLDPQRGAIRRSEHSSLLSWPK